MLFLVLIWSFTGALLFTWLKHKFIQAELRQERFDNRLKVLEHEEDNLEV